MKKNTTVVNDNKGLSVIDLEIDQYFFDQILTGERKEECREITRENERQFILIDDENYAIEDENGNSIPVKYDAIRFKVGDNNRGDNALVRIADSYTQILVDEDGNPQYYLLDPNKSLEDDSNVFYIEEIVYVLGEVIERDLHS